jgi:UrcA family protein
MHTQPASFRTLLAMVIAGSLFGGLAEAKNYGVVVSKPVSTAGLDLGNPADAQTLYMRLRRAADDVCTRGTRIDLLPSDNPRGCLEKALGNAVRQAHSPLVTQAYLVDHTLHDAATWGIELPSEVAKR